MDIINVTVVSFGEGVDVPDGDLYEEVEKLGMKIFRTKAIPMGYCIFMEVDKVADNLPNWIRLHTDPFIKEHYFKD